MSLPKGFWFSIVAFVGVACAPAVQSVAYTPQPQRVSDPRAELKALVASNTSQGCVTESAFEGPSFVVKFVCTRSIGNVVLRFDRVAAVELQQQGKWYRVRVHHREGGDDFVWDSKSLEDAQRISDCVEAILHPTRAETPAPASTSL